jgi:hypothetical protein
MPDEIVKNKSCGGRGGRFWRARGKEQDGLWIHDAIVGLDVNLLEDALVLRAHKVNRSWAPDDTAAQPHLEISRVQIKTGDCRRNGQGP